MRFMLMSFARKIKAAILVLALVFSLVAIQQKPVQASCCAADTAALTGILAFTGGIFKAVGSLLAAFNTYLKAFYLYMADFTTYYLYFVYFAEAIRKDLAETTSILNATMQTQTAAITKVMQGVTDNSTKDMIAAQTLKTVAENTPPSPTNTQLCNNVVARQARLIGKSYADYISRMMLDGIMNSYRGSKADGSGPEYAIVGFLGRCNKDVPTGNENDEYPSELSKCVETTEADGKNKMRSFQDADINYSLFDGQLALRKPVFKETQNEKGKKVYVPSIDGSSSDAEKFWYLAMSYCYKLAGPRPTPPSGKEMAGMSGSADMEQWRHCAASQSALLKQCTDKVAYHTMPNPDDTFSTEFAAASMQACNSAKEAGLELPSTFDNCNTPLSLYQMDYIAHALCFSANRAIDDAGSGMNYGDITTQNDICNNGYTQWMTKLAVDDSNLIKAASDLRDMKECWPEGGGGKKVVSAPYGVKKGEYKKINLKKPANGNDDSGVGMPVFADEIEFPMTVAQ